MVMKNLPFFRTIFVSFFPYMKTESLESSYHTAHHHFALGMVLSTKLDSLSSKKTDDTGKLKE
jgi:hypothetical protein